MTCSRSFRALFLLFPALGCASTPPANWATGGAHLTITQARWNRSDATVEITADGKVLVDRNAILGVDAAGRVFETDGDPIAILEPDGMLVGKDNTMMGMVGPHTAAFPGTKTAWVSVGPRGEVIRFDSDGERSQDGYWEGCSGPVLQTCTLVTHVLLLREWQRRPRVGIGIGVGIGVMH